MKHVPYTTGTDKKIILSAMGAKKMKNMRTYH